MKKTGLIILDGWGHREEKTNNAIALAHTPHYDKLIQDSPNTLLCACGKAVGLPDGQIGNSEVGHLHIGAGRRIPQSLTLINQSSAKNFSDQPNLIEKLKKCTHNNKALHIIGLLSLGGVHSHQNHIFSLLRLCKEIGILDVYIHVITDGRDTPPTCCEASIIELEKVINEIGIGIIASLCGRFYAMDRDNRWERTEKFYQLMVNREANYRAQNAQEAVKIASQKQQCTDEFIEPIIVGDAPSPGADDTLVLMNFRVDRMRQITKALTDQSFHSFPILQTFKNVITLTEYHSDYNALSIFPPHYPNNCFGEHIANLGLRQMRIAETEKYPHVTYFFNGGKNIQYPNEQQILIPSPKVNTYDQQPEMSAQKIKNKLIQAMENDEMDTFICNFANTDMVGHSGNLKATIKAAETVDQIVGEICKVAEKNNWQIAITADHGNAEIMQDDHTNEPHTAHTLSLVPFIIFNAQDKRLKMKKEGELIDISPTLFHLLEKEAPLEMTGEILYHLNA